MARAALDLADQLLYEPCYDTLRTKEQLGYAVHSGGRLTHGVQGLCVVVQSGAHGAAHLDARIDAFLSSFQAKLEAMGEAEFEQNRAALLAAKLQRDHNLLEESDRAWDAAVSRGRDFGARRDEVAALRRISPAQVRELFERALEPGAPGRRKLAVHVVARQHAGELAAAPGGAAELVPDLDALKQRLGFFPAVVEVAQR
jgi:nardilysin